MPHPSILAEEAFGRLYESLADLGDPYGGAQEHWVYHQIEKIRRDRAVGGSIVLLGEPETRLQAFIAAALEKNELLLHKLSAAEDPAGASDIEQVLQADGAIQLLLIAPDVSEPRIANVWTAIGQRLSHGSIVAQLPIQGLNPVDRGKLSRATGKAQSETLGFFSIVYFQSAFSVKGYAGAIHAIIPVHNRIRYTFALLESLKAQTVFDRIKVMVVDDGSSDGTAEKIGAEHPYAEIVQGSGDLFWTGGVHLGIETIRDRLQENDFILLLNNDVRLSANTVEVLLEEASRFDKCCIVPIAVSANSATATGWAGGTQAILNNLPRMLDEMARRGYAMKLDTVYGRCSLMSANIVSDIGNYDKDVFRHYHGDSDYGFRANSAGYMLMVSGRTVIEVEETADTSGEQIVFFDKPRSLVEIVKYAFSIRSPDNLLLLWRFQSRHNRRYRVLVFVRIFWRIFSQWRPIHFFLNRVHRHGTG